jgi:hypothetical protein
VEGTPPIIRAAPSAAPVILAGDGEGVVDAASAGLVDNSRALLYSAGFGRDDAALRDQIARGAILVVTDTNREPARRWSTLSENNGFTEGPDQQVLRKDPSDARLDVFPDAPSDAFTTAEQRGVHSVAASAYGNPISYTPEDRPVRALDGDTQTAWKVGAFSDVTGEHIRVRLAKPITTDHLNLVQPVIGDRNRFITDATITFDGRDALHVGLGPESREVAGQTITFARRSFRELDIRIDNTNYGQTQNYTGASAVGFAEIRVGDSKPGSRTITADEVIRMPRDLLDVAGRASMRNPLVVLMTRDRVYPVAPRYDPELRMVREFEVPTRRSFAVGGAVRLSSIIEDSAMDRLLGAAPLAAGGVEARSSIHLAADPRGRASSAFDGDRSSAWTTPFADLKGQWLQATYPSPQTFDHLDLSVVVDGQHSVPTRLTLSTDTGARRTLRLPPVRDGSARGATRAVTVSFPALTASRVRTRRATS